MTICKVKRATYKKLSQADLAVFTKVLVQNVQDNNVYTMLENEVQQLVTLESEYEKALVTSRDRSILATTKKNDCKAALINALNEFSDGLDYFAKGRKSFILETGLKLQETGTRHPSKQNPLMPVDVIVRSVGEVGCLSVNYSLQETFNVLNVAVEWTADNGNTWNNGNYFTNGKGTMRNLPSLSEIQVRLRSIGRNDKKSQWTTPVKVPVL